MSTPGAISGPLRVDQPHHDLPHALTDLIGRVTVSGGATGFTATTELETISALAKEIVDDVAARPKLRHMLIMGEENALAGAIVLRPSAQPVVRHRAEVEWLLVDPELQGNKLGTYLLDAGVEHARALGITQLYLYTRSGQQLEAFYTRRGWVERGRWPNSLHVGDEDVRDQIWFTRDL
ncbi:GNAT family N-acetyltransferase [Parasphingorhabdus pacifica]